MASITNTTELDLTHSTDYKEGLNISPEKIKDIRTLIIRHATRFSYENALAYDNHKSIGTEYSDWRFNGTSVEILFDPKTPESEPIVNMRRNNFFLNMDPDGASSHNLDVGYEGNLDDWVNTSIKLLEVAETKKALSWEIKDVGTPVENPANNSI